MDYDKIKLGFIDRFKVWKLRREIRQYSEWRDEMEGGFSEIDYLRSEKLEAELLEVKKIKKATKDAIKKYKKEDRGIISCEEFIEQYLIQNGLKKKMLTEGEKTKRYDFISKCPIKQIEEFDYENITKRKNIYYEIDGVKYELPYNILNMYLEQIKKGDYKQEFFPELRTNNGIDYYIYFQEMIPENKYNMLKNIIDMYLKQISEKIYMMTQENLQTEIKKEFSKLTGQILENKYESNNLYQEGKIKDGIVRQEEMIKRLFEFDKNILKDEQEIIK